MAKQSSKGKSKKQRKSAARLEYEHQLKLYKRRVSSWEKTKHAVYTDTPTKGKQSYAQAAEKLKNIRWSRLSEEAREKAREEYEYRYEENGLDETDFSPNYTPNTEQDYFNNSTNYKDSYSQAPYNEPVNAYREYDAAINDLIEQILDTTGIDRVNTEIENILRGLLNDSRTRMGDKEFYKRMNGERLSRLQQAAQKGLASYRDRHGNNYNGQSAITEFATILNMDIALSDEQEQTLSEEGYVNFDYDVYYEDDE